MNHILERKPFETQRDNHLSPNGTCGPTGHVNGLHAVGLELPHPGFDQEEDYLTDWLEKPEAVSYMLKHYPVAKGSSLRPRHFGEIIAWAVNQIMRPVVGSDVVFRKARTMPEMAQAILSDRPLVVSTNFTSFGHFICLVGVDIADDVTDLSKLKDEDIRAFYADDSWGDYNLNYKSRNGNNVRYTSRLLRDMLKGSENGFRWTSNLITNPAHDKGGYVPAA